MDTFNELVDLLVDVRAKLAANASPVVAAPAAAPTTRQDDLIVTMADSYQLPVVIVRAMVAHESVGGITHAARFEQEFYDRYIKPLKAVPRPEGCSQATERILRATSFGLMQVMGQTAREMGFAGWLTELTVPAVGLEWGCRYLRQLSDKYLAEGGWPGVMRAYNGGPGNWDNLASKYPSLILARIPGGVWPE